jgi:hypothetical protein
METKIRDLTSQLAKANAAGAAGMVPQPPPPSAGGVPEQEVQARIAAAVAEEQERAAAQLDEQMNDLLVCLGQVRRGVERFNGGGGSSADDIMR